MTYRIFPALLLLLPALARAQGAPDAGTPAPAAETTCLEAPPGGEDDASVLAPLQLEVEGRERTLSAVELHGLTTLDKEEVRKLALLPASGPLTVEQAQAMLVRLARTGLFARVAPRVRLTDGQAPVLEVALTENPRLSAVRFEGLTEVQSGELLEELLEVPVGADDPDVTRLELRSSGGRLSAALTTGRDCPPPVPPARLLARLGPDGEVRPGLVHGGVGAGLERVLEELRREGYVLARLSATLGADGVLAVSVDEGRLEGVEVRGVDPALAPRVTAALGFEKGDVLLRSDARKAMERLEARLPFVRVDPDVDGQRLPRARVVEDGPRAWRTREEPAPAPRRRERVEWNGWEDVFRTHRRGGSLPRGLTVEGRTLVVHLAPRRPDVDFTFLPLHTQVTGFTPGVTASLRTFDPLDRVQPTLDAGVFVPLRLGHAHVPGDPEQTRDQQRAQWLLGAKVQLTRLHLAEVGVQVHDFADTPDRWRLGWFDSSLYSALINRPDAEYFRRTGFSTFATARFAEHGLAGLEYRRDAHGAMAPLTAFTFFDRDEVARNAPATGGRMASVVGRLEWASDVDGDARVGSLFRRPETSLFGTRWEWPEQLAVRGLATLEVARPGLGGDAASDFWKGVLDGALYMPVAGHDGLRLRARLAGGGGASLPVQKQEGLGGWNALRGYRFKELEGDASALLSAEYRFGFLGGFADVGGVHRDGGWTEPKVGVGASLYLGDAVDFSVAWRVDGQGGGVPEARLLFQRTF